ncbi:MAG: hypothetical protein IKI73_06935 [Firmicutes bacterium]|nr:hypothetical protein [Bacillota bacterium]
MEKKNKTLVLRILMAVCFLWMPVNGVRGLISANVLQSGDIVAILAAALPALAGLVLLIGALTGSRVVMGIGCVIDLLCLGYSIYVYIMSMQQDLPAEAKKGFRGLIISTAIMLLALLVLALACFIKRSDLALCILAVVLFVVWFFVSRSGYAAGQSQLPLMLTAGGAVLGTIITAMFFAVTKKKKVEA